MTTGSRSTGDRVMQVGLAVNLLLTVVKLWAGYAGHSEAVVADGMESASDLVAVASVMAAIRIGGRPLDVHHPYGHGKAESIGAVLVAVVIFVTGAWIAVDAVGTLTSRDFLTPGVVAVAAAAGTIICKELLYRYTEREGRRLQSPAVRAIAADHRKDAITSIATLAGVGGAYLGFPFLDPAAALVTSVFIFRIGYSSFREAAYDLMDGTPPEFLLSEITGQAERVPGVEHVLSVKGRRYGRRVMIDLEVAMDEGMTVSRSHEVADAVSRTITERFSTVDHVMIHVEPHREHGKTA